MSYPEYPSNGPAEPTAGPPRSAGDDLTGSAPPSRPTSVLVGAVMSWVGGTFGIVIGFALLLASGSDEFRKNVKNGSAGVTTIRLLGILLMLWCILVIGLAVMAFLRRHWAAIALAVMAGIYTLISVFGMINSGSPSGIPGVFLSVTAVALFFSGSKAWYSAR